MLEKAGVSVNSGKAAMLGLPGQSIIKVYGPQVEGFNSLVVILSIRINYLDV